MENNPGKEVSEIGNDYFRRGSKLAVDASGTHWVVDGYYRLFKWTRSSWLNEVWSGVGGITVAHTGKMWISRNRTLAYAPSWTQTPNWHHPVDIERIVAHVNGNIWAAASDDGNDRFVSACWNGSQWTNAEIINTGNGGTSFTTKFSTSLDPSGGSSTKTYSDTWPWEVPLGAGTKTFYVRVVDAVSS